MSKDLYDKLGVNKKASKKEIKTAYRKKARETHPDHGGNADEFSEVAKAYHVLIDDGKRRQYDTNGSVEAEKDPNAMAYGVIAGIVEGILANALTPEFDLVGDIKKALLQRQKNLENIVPDKQKAIATLDKMLEKIKKRPVIDVMGNVIENHRSQLKGEISNITKDIEVHKKALDILKEYEYSYELPTQFAQAMKIGNFQNTFNHFGMWGA